MKLFTRLIQSINEFKPDEPIVLESELEELLSKHLRQKGFNVTSQVTSKPNRYDLITTDNDESVCIELKLKSDISNIKQFDKYLPKFKDGFIVVCWQATPSIKAIFDEVIEQSPVPVTLIELSREYSIA